MQRIARNVSRLDQPLLAARDIGNDDRCPPRRAFGIEGFEDVELHDC
jgi:hypothetical protein